MSVLDEIRPSQQQRVMDLLEQAGVDVSDWQNYGGKHPASNPRYCYNWSFIEPGQLLVTCLWHDELTPTDDNVIFISNVRHRWPNPNMTKRAADFDDNLQTAYTQALPVRAIVIAGRRRDIDDDDSNASQVKQRLLDAEPWAITSYDFKTGDFVITRGAQPFQDVEPSDPEYVGFEGDMKLKYVKHRRRENRLRAKKIMAAKYENGGRLICEVPGCGFDFYERYGPPGQDFAHVHHSVPLAEAPDTGRNTPLKDLKIVCANCHAMIHRYGKCLPLDGLIP